MGVKYIWMDGELIDWSDATVHVTTCGLHYGIGFFEGIRCYASSDGPVIFRLADHVQRLLRSARIHGFRLPVSSEEISAACRSVVSANHLTDCYVRPIAFLGDGPDPFCARFRIAVIATENGPINHKSTSKGSRARISTFCRMSANTIPPAAKATGQYLNSFLARAEAVNSGCDEAILLNANGFVADGWAHNIFIVRNKDLLTPTLSAGALAGITRDTIITLAREAGYAVLEKDLVRSDLYLADECFLTGTAAGVVPLVEVDARPVGSGLPGAVTTHLMNTLSAVAHGTNGVHPEWRENVG